MNTTKVKIMITSTEIMVGEYTKDPEELAVPWGVITCVHLILIC